MNIRFLSMLLPIVFLSVCGCGRGPKSGWGFTLPDGQVERGQTAFVELKCTACHTVTGVELAGDDEPERNVVLGGEVGRIQTYGELVTSIINPSHKLAAGYPPQDVQEDGESKMRNYNDVMTVDQLVDLVAFLQSHYELSEIEPTHYPMY